eukprot:XP_019928218.1 PREDICTED: uncharacterized protein LOC109620384 [Crassostrea gigas]
MARVLMRKLRYSKLSSMYVKKRMVLYFKSLYDEMEKNERKDNIKIFVMTCFVNHLLNLEMKPKLDDVMLKFEDSMNRECSRKEGRRKTEWAMKLGLMIDESDGKIYIRSIARRFCDGYGQITGVNNDALEALIQFTKFCALLSNTNNVEVLPHLNQLVLWMEYFITVAFCLSAKVQNTPNFFFVIPESYTAVIYFIDATFVQERGVSTFEAVQRHSMRNTVQDNKLIQERLKKLIEILCGVTSSTNINLFSYIFQSNHPNASIDHRDYGIAERLLVLAPVLVCNLGKSVYPVVETKLMSELCKIKVREEYPSRLSEALTSVQRAGSPADVARALQILLLKRENDSLWYCIWDNFDRRNGLQKRKLKAMELSNRFFLEETLQGMNTPHDIVSSKVRTEIDEDDEMDTQITLEEKMEIDRIKMEKKRNDEENEASKKITKFFGKVVFRLRVKNLSTRVVRQLCKEKRVKEMKIFESMRITNKGCGICGVQFKGKATGCLFNKDEQTSNDSEFALLLQESPMFMLQKCLESQEEHGKSEKHKEMVNYYQHFQHKYMQKIFDPLGKVRSFIQRYKLGTAEFVEKNFKEETYNIGILRRQRESVENKIENIIKGCEWQNGEIWGEVQELIGSYHLIKDYVETEARKREERLEKLREVDLARRPKGRGKRKGQRR